jgi:hypothetical protein
MFCVDAGKTGRYCDGLARRSFLQLGVAGMASLGLGDVLRAKAASQGGNDASVILIWLDGGPSHIDLYDMKHEGPTSFPSSAPCITTAATTTPAATSC